MTNNMNILILTTIGMLLVGCQTTKQLSSAFRSYEEPLASNPHALLRVNSDGFIHFNPNSECVDYDNPRAGIAISKEKLFLGARGYNGQKRGVTGKGIEGDDMAEGEFRVDANHPFTISYSTTWSNGSKLYNCNFSASFTPIENAHYQVTTTKVGSEKCGMLVKELLPKQRPVNINTTDKCEN